MDFKDYQQQALVTSSKPDSKDSKEKAIAIWCIREFDRYKIK